MVTVAAAKSTISNALSNYTAWKNKLPALFGTKVSDPNCGYSDTACQFGMWLYSPDTTKTFVGKKEYAAVKLSHDAFHKAAHKALTLAFNKDGSAASGAAKVALDDYNTKATKFFADLTAWSASMH